MIKSRWLFVTTNPATSSTRTGAFGFVIMPPAVSPAGFFFMGALGATIKREMRDMARTALIGAPGGVGVGVMILELEEGRLVNKIITCKIKKQFLLIVIFYG
jgi:hypothetical protein